MSELGYTASRFSNSVTAAILDSGGRRSRLTSVVCNPRSIDVSWDVFIMRRDSTTESLQSLVSLPEDFMPSRMGDAGALRNRIRTVLPEVDWSEPSWGRLEGDGYSIEFNIQKEGIIDSFMLHVRGGGDALVDITRMCKANGWLAVDCSDGSVIDLDKPSREGWESFQRYRDNVRAKQEGGE